MDFSKLNKIACNAFPPTRPVKSLKVGCNYPIKKLVKLNTKFGPRVKAVLEEGEEVFETFLPARICTYLYENDPVFEMIQDSNGEMLMCIGKSSSIEFKSK